jgi:hypothetical protein
LEQQQAQVAQEAVAHPSVALKVLGLLDKVLTAEQKQAQAEAVLAAVVAEQLP